MQIKSCHAARQAALKYVKRRPSNGKIVVANDRTFMWPMSAA
jgi:hypothetical protein